MKMIVMSLHCALIPSIALADMPPSDSERAAVYAVGCRGGRIEKDDGGFEVEDVICDWTPDYELILNASYEVVSKRYDD